MKIYLNKLNPFCTNVSFYVNAFQYSAPIVVLWDKGDIRTKWVEKDMRYMSLERSWKSHVSSNDKSWMFHAGKKVKPMLQWYFNSILIHFIDTSDYILEITSGASNENHIYNRKRFANSSEMKVQTTSANYAKSYL